MKPESEQSKPTSHIKPVPPQKPSVPVVRRVVNEKVINRRDVALGR
jgi:hypothetical protein